MKNEKYFLSIDNGTQSVRAMVFDGEGQLIAKSKVEIDKEIFTLKNLHLCIKASKENFAVLVTSAHSNSNLQEGDIIKEVNREVVNNSKEFIDLINTIEKTGRGSLLLKILRDDQSLWITIKFVK